MGKNIFDFDNGDFLFKTSDNMAMDADGNLIMRMSDNMAMNMDTDTGELHITSSWNDDNEDDF